MMKYDADYAGELIEFLRKYSILLFTLRRLNVLTLNAFAQNMFLIGKYTADLEHGELSADAVITMQVWRENYARSIANFVPKDTAR